jgi:hypothetical protein
MPVKYSVDFHIPVKETAGSRTYELETDEVLSVDQLLGLLAQRFSTVRSLMRYSAGNKLPVAVLVGGRILEPSDAIPDGSVIKIIGAVAGG